MSGSGGGDGGDDDDRDRTDVDVDDDDAIYRELTSFLASPRNDVRKAAASAVLAALSSPQSNEASKRLTSCGGGAVVPLCRIASASDQGGCGSNDALRCLLVMCSDDVVGDQSVLDFVGNSSGGDDGDDDDRGGRGIARMLEIALSSPPQPPPAGGPRSSSPEWAEWAERVDLACALLANATRIERGATELVGLSFPDGAIPTASSSSSSSSSSDSSSSVASTKGKDAGTPAATLLLSRFLNPAYVDEESEGYAASLRASRGGGTGVDDEGGGGRRRRRSSSDDVDEGSDEEIVEEGASSSPSSNDANDPTGRRGDHHDPYQHVAAVIMNVAQLERGRDFLMRLIHHSGGDGKKETTTTANGSANNATSSSTKSASTTNTTTSHLQSLLPQLSSSPNPVRRRGIAGAVKNCCFSQDSAWWLLNVVYVDKSLLMPLAGPEELSLDEKVGLDPDYWLLGPGRVRETDAIVRLHVAEALLLLLASGRRARDTLRARRSYVIVKLADMVEEDEEVTERLLEIVQYLRRDEDGTEEGSSDRRAYESYARGLMEADGAKNRAAGGGSAGAAASSSSSGAALASEGRGGGDGGAVDYDNVD